MIFTTRPDTLWGATFMVLAPEHPLVDGVTSDAQRAAVEAYQEQAARMDEIQRGAADKEKTGVFTGGYATNPVNGERIPIWIADYVMMGYGTGAIMAVPAPRRARLCLCQPSTGWRFAASSPGRMAPPARWRSLTIPKTRAR